jgi:hypothetical protein
MVGVSAFKATLQVASRKVCDETFRLRVYDEGLCRVGKWVVWWWVFDNLLVDDVNLLVILNDFRMAFK